MVQCLQTGPVYELDKHRPILGNDAFIAPTAAVIGDVDIGEGASIWFGAVIRGDDMPIRIGRRTNIQDGAIIHSTKDVVIIGDDVTIGHGAILHGCTIEDEALIGIGAIILDGAHIGQGAIVGAHAFVPPGRQIPAGELWLGSPVSFKRKVGDDIKDSQSGVSHYMERAAQYQRNGIGQ
jgi:gamma-carbonic anhydrase